MAMNGFHSGFSSSELDPEQYEPVASSFYGLRAFLIDTGAGSSSNDFASGLPPNGGPVTWNHAGALRAVYRTQYMWGPLTNSASCMPVMTWAGKVATPPHPQGRPVTAACACGFWAFTSGKHVLSVAGHAALGVIQGWGRMVIGTDGFRAERARIVALTFDTDPHADDPEPASGVRGALSKALQLVVGRGSVLPQPSLDPKPLLPKHLSKPDLLDKVAANYPDAEIFPTVADMLRAWPCTDLTSLLGGEQ